MATSQQEQNTVDTATDGELVVRTSVDLVQLGELERILLANEAPAGVVEDDPESISREIIAEILAAKSDDELEMSSQATGWRELLDVPMKLHGFRWRPSSFEDGSAVFFVVSATRLDTGERLVLTTGSRNALAQMTNMARRGTLEDGAWALVEAEKKTRGGFLPLWLVRVPQGEAGASA